MPVDSPCVRNCCLDKHDICVGCGRSLKEIMQWASALPHKKIQILDAAEKRKQHRALRYSTISVKLDK